MDVTLEGWNHHNDPAMKKSDQPGGSLKVDGEFQNERMTEHGRLHDLFQERMASKTPYTTKDLLKDARNLLELDLILLPLPLPLPLPFASPGRSVSTLEA